MHGEICARPFFCYYKNVNQYFNFLILGSVVGILLGSFINWGLSLVGLFLLIAVGLIVLNKKYLSVGLICLGLALGLTRMALVSGPGANLAQSAGEEVSFNATVVAEPDYRDAQTKLTVRPDGFNDKILINAPPYESYQYGARLAATGTLAWPKSFTTDNGRTFNYQKYLAKDGVFFTLERPVISALPSTGGSAVLKSLFKLKAWFTGRLQILLPEPESSLMAGLLVGEQQSLGDEWNNRFRAAGLSHIVVLSGYNLSVVAENVLRLANLFLARNLSLFTGAVGIIAFAAMAGGGAAVVRAALMALIALLARYTGRVYQATLALVAAGLVMILWNPLTLRYDLGFQLSFLATLGVIHGPPLLAPYFHKLTDRFGLKEVLLTTLSAQIIVLPWILYTTGNLSLIALPANLLVLPAVPVTMLVGFLTVFISPLAFVTHFLLAYILLIVKLAASLPGAAFIINQFPLGLTVICYVSIFYWTYVKNKKPAPQKGGAGVSSQLS